MCDCIFCKIANHEIPSTVVYEDDQVIAFDDLNPQAPVHTLVIPKKHYSDIADNVPAETMGAMAHAIQEVAKAKGLEDGFRVISNKGVNAGQTVMHFHMHVLGGKNLQLMPGYQRDAGEVRTNINLGLKYRLWDSVYLQAGLMRGRDPAFGVNGQFDMEPEGILVWKKPPAYVASERLRWRAEQATNAELAALMAEKGVAWGEA